MNNQNKSREKYIKNGFRLKNPKSFKQSDETRGKCKKSAFTLIELIVVMAVIGILVLLASPKFLGYTERARETKHIHTAKVIETALEVYLINGGAFPDDLEVIDKTSLEGAAMKESLIGVNGYVLKIEEDVYYELTYDFIKKLDVKLSAKNQLFVEALASSSPSAVYATEKGITLVDKYKTMKGYEVPSIEQPSSPKAIARVITAGADHSILMTSSGQLFSWGGNDYGQLGINSTAINQKTPKQIDTITDVTSVSTGVKHVLALTSSNEVYAWGNNENGELGLGYVSQKVIAPTLVSSLNDVIDVSVGPGFSLALKKDGTVWIWGKLYSKTFGTTPVKIEGLSDIIEVSAGQSHLLALKKDGTVWCMGNNTYGQLGDGTSAAYSDVVQVSNEDELFKKIKHISAGHNHSMALLEDGSVWSWGLNSNGQLGDNTNTNKLKPIKIIDSGKVSYIASGANHSLAIIDGRIYAWGSNAFGGLGDGTTTARKIPTLSHLNENVIHVEGGNHHTIAVTEDGSVWSWGQNQNGALGDGTTTNRVAPFKLLYDINLFR